MKYLRKVPFFWMSEISDIFSPPHDEFKTIKHPLSFPIGVSPLPPHTLNPYFFKL